MAPGSRIELSIRALITGGVLRNQDVAHQLGLHLIDLQALNLLALAGGQMTPSALAEALFTPRSSVSRIVRRLEAAGYVHRRESPTDRRSVSVEIDTNHFSAVSSQYQRQAEHLATVLSTFNEHDTAVIEKFLGTLIGRDPDSA